MKVEIPFVNSEGKLEKKTGELVDIIKQEEPWSEYFLKDGTIIRTKQTALQIAKLDELDINGKPIYNMQTQPNIVVIPNI